MGTPMGMLSIVQALGAGRADRAGRLADAQRPDHLVHAHGAASALSADLAHNKVAGRTAGHICSLKALDPGSGRKSRQVARHPRTPWCFNPINLVLKPGSFVLQFYSERGLQRSCSARDAARVVGRTAVLFGLPQLPG